MTSSWSLNPHWIKVQFAVCLYQHQSSVMLHVLELQFFLFVTCSSSVMQLFRLTNWYNTFLYKGCYRWSWFEARSKICSAQRQAKLRGKNKVKFRTSSKRISLVCNILVYCEGVDCKVTGIKFMTVFITQRDAECFQLGLQPHCRSVFLVTVRSMPLSACISHTAVVLD